MEKMTHSKNFVDFQNQFSNFGYKLNFCDIIRLKHSV